MADTRGRTGSTHTEKDTLGPFAAPAKQGEDVSLVAPAWMLGHVPAAPVPARVGPGAMRRTAPHSPRS